MQRIWWLPGEPPAPARTGSCPACAPARVPSQCLRRTRTRVSAARTLGAGRYVLVEDAALAPSQGLQVRAAACVANEMNPEAYLADVLTQVQSHPNNRLDELLPVAWMHLRSVDTS